MEINDMPINVELLSQRLEHFDEKLTTIQGMIKAALDRTDSTRTEMATMCASLREANIRLEGRVTALDKQMQMHQTIIRVFLSLLIPAAVGGFAYWAVKAVSG